MKKLSLFIFALLLALNVHTLCAQVYTTSAANLSFFSSARLEDIEATSKKGSVVLNTATNEVLFKVTISSFVFKNGLMQEHFNETYMESAKYPNAEFRGKINETINYAVPGEYKVTVTGSLTIHGVIIDRTIPGTITVKAGMISLSSSFIVPVSAHKIDIPNDKISNIAQDIKVSVHADCTPYVKK